VESQAEFQMNPLARQAAEDWFNMNPNLPGYDQPGPDQEKFRKDMVNRLAGHLESYFLREVSHLVEALGVIMEEYEDRKIHFGDEYLWKKNEDSAQVTVVKALRDCYKNDGGDHR
jgi:hypothetical protein